MSFHSRDNFSSNKNTKIKRILILVVLVLIFIFSLPWSKGILFGIGTPFWKLRTSLINFTSNSIETLRSKNSLIEENNLLKEQISKNEKDKIVLDLIKKENEDLKDILNRKIDNKKYILSSVLVKPFLSTYDTLIIDVGTNDGVKVGNKVLANGNSFIGYVSETYNNTSKIILYSSFGEKTPVLIGENSVEKEAIGIGSGNFKVEMPRESGIKEGDSVVMPSISSNIFGIVERIEFKATDSFQNVLFKSPVNISELKWVEVVI